MGIIGGTTKPVKTAAANVCRSVKNKTAARLELWEALANRMYKTSGSFCVFDLNNPDSVAFKWKKKKSCWLKVDMKAKPNDSCSKMSNARTYVVQRAASICAPTADRVFTLEDGTDKFE